MSVSSAVAVVDLGTITSRLLIRHGDQEIRHQPVTHMGRELGHTGAIGSDALHRVAEVLDQHRREIDAVGVKRVWAIATQAARIATDQDDLVAVVRDRLGVDLDIIDGEDEGRLAFAGASETMRHLDAEQRSILRRDAAGTIDAATPVIVIDIGGGSTELSYGTSDGAMSGVISLPIGASVITSTYLEHDPPWASELSAALSIIELHLDDALRELPNLDEAIRSGVVIGVGGTMTTMAAVEIGVADPTAEGPVVLTAREVEEVFRTLVTEPRADRIHNPGLPPERVDLILGGACIMVESMRHLGISALVVSNRDLLDGAAASLVQR